jgi:tRNA threonylcarbamoyl adenosine modification protein YeaZ
MTADGPVLAIESSTAYASCAVGAGGPPVEVVEEGRAVELLPRLTSSALRAAGIGANELSAVVVGAGPGSFMGIRAAVSFANGLSYAVRCSIASVSTLDSAAVAVTGPGERTLVALEAGRGRFYAAAYSVGEAGAPIERVLPGRLVEPGELERLAGELGEPARAFATGGRIDGNVHPNAGDHLALARVRPDWLDWHAVAGALPRYRVGPPGPAAHVA